MFDLIGRYVAEKYLRFENGQIWFGKERIVFYFVPHLVREFVFNRKINGVSFAATQFIAGRTQGQLFVLQHGIPLMKSLTPVVRISCEILHLFGFGAFRTIKVDDQNGFMVLTGKSTLALEMKTPKQGDEPVDFMLGGLFAGALQYYTKTPMYAVETACVAQHDVAECVWVVGSRKRILDYIETFSPEKAGWASTLLDQIAGVEKEMQLTGEDK